MRRRGSLVFKSRIRTIRPGIPRIDWSHPLAQGLIGCYLPGVTGGKNLAGMGGDMLSATTPAKYNTLDGPGISLVANGALLYGIAPTAFKTFTGGTSLFWHGWIDANQGVAVSGLYPTYLGVTYNSSGSAPYYVAGMYADLPNKVTMGGNSGGSQLTIATDVVPASAMCSIAASYNWLGTNTLYVNGVPDQTSTSGGGAPASTSTSTITMGANATTAIGATGAYQYPTIGLIWNVTLSAAQQAQLAADPYGMFIWPGDEMFAHSHSVITPVVFRKTLSSIGGRVGTRQLVGWLE